MWALRLRIPPYYGLPRVPDVSLKPMCCSHGRVFCAALGGWWRLKGLGCSAAVASVWKLLFLGSVSSEVSRRWAAFHVLIKNPIILDLEWAQRRGKFCAMRCGMVPMVFEDVCWQGRACYAQNGSRKERAEQFALPKVGWIPASVFLSLTSSTRPFRR